MTQSTAPFALIARFTVHPGAEDAFNALVARTLVGIRAKEPGTLIYTCHRVDSAPRQWIFYELYRDRAAFEDHENQEHIQRFLAERESLLERTEVDFLALVEGKTPQSVK